jgi:hypothetical protein
MNPVAEEAHVLRKVIFASFLICAAATPSAAGYSFSISASSKDPFVNVSPSTNTVRALYLWLTCAEEGISAFEGDVTGTMKVLGFTPLNDAMNVGGATNLLLAVGGCPKGPTLNFLLGYWVVMDRGGTLCLGPSATNRLIGAVSCGGDPNLTEDPEVSGFSSTRGETPAGEPALDSTASSSGGAPDNTASSSGAAAREPCFAGKNGCRESAPNP